MSIIGGTVGNNDATAEHAAGSIRVRFKSRTSGRMGGDDLEIIQNRSDDGTREFVFQPKPPPPSAD
jgi:hypothetical protein